MDSILVSLLFFLLADLLDKHRNKVRAKCRK